MGDGSDAKFDIFQQSGVIKVQNGPQKLAAGTTKIKQHNVKERQNETNIYSTKMNPVNIKAANVGKKEGAGQSLMRVEINCRKPQNSPRPLPSAAP